MVIRFTLLAITLTLSGCTTFRRPLDRGTEISSDLNCPATRVVRWYHPVSNVLTAIRTARRTCGREGKCLKSISELEPNVFYAVCTRFKEENNYAICGRPE